jgi:hypothetical protein
MSSDGNHSRRVFLRGAAAAAAAVPAAVVAGCDTPGGTTRAATPVHKAAIRRAVPENSLPGDPHWGISNLGAPDEVMGYAGQSSVLPGQPVDLYVSTTSREFKVAAFRIGWYNGDLARRCAVTGRARPASSRRPARSPPTGERR